jgi:hypothetical protein
MLIRCLTMAARLSPTVAPSDWLRRSPRSLARRKERPALHRHRIRAQRRAQLGRDHRRDRAVGTQPTTTFTSVRPLSPTPITEPRGLRRNINRPRCRGGPIVWMGWARQGPCRFRSSNPLRHGPVSRHSPRPKKAGHFLGRRKLRRNSNRRGGPNTRQKPAPSPRSLGSVSFQNAGPKRARWRDGQTTPP